jgi:hypothetical protein
MTRREAAASEPCCIEEPAAPRVWTHCFLYLYCLVNQPSSFERVWISS